MGIRGQIKDKRCGVAFSEYKDYGAAWGSEDDVRRLSKRRGEDVLRSVKSALI